MDETSFRLSLYLPAQGASESEATIIEWHVSEGDRFRRGQSLAQVDSAKSVFDFEAPCDGIVIRRHYLEGDTVQLAEPLLDIETSDQAMRDWIPPAVDDSPLPAALPPLVSSASPSTAIEAVMLGIGSYLPKRVVSNSELLAHLPHITEKYVEQVTGIRERRWAADGEKPSDMAYAAALEAIARSGVATKEIDAIILATTTPDVAMPATANILQDRLNLPTIPAFDLNAACSGWLYAVGMARSMVVSRMARNVLAVGVDMQSRLLDRLDESAYFLFGDGAGAAIISGGTQGHRIRQVYLGADTRGLRMARRWQPGYAILDGQPDVDPWIRLDGPALFRAAAESFTALVKNAVEQAGWRPESVRWVVPHQANGRILKAAAKRSGVPFARFYLNMDHVGNTSSASIPIALSEVEESLQPGDKLLLCSVGAGLATAAVAVEW
ncbi:MAG: beta-ketoacyl-ACP synthase 3 [Planctomycetota bacterium]